MSNAGRSVFVFGIYLTFLGATLIVVPNVLLGVFRLPAVTDVWIRVVGMLVLCLAFYYLQAARRGLADFFPWTVYVRCAVFVTLLAFAALKLAEPQLALLGVIDLLGATWTALAIRQSRFA